MDTHDGASPPRVVIVSHTADVGGAEIALLRLLEARDRGRFDIRAITLVEGAFADRLRALGVPTRVLAAGELARVTRYGAVSSRMTLFRNVLSSFQVARRLRRLLREEAPDLVAANSLKGAVLVAIARPRATPWVWHLHDRLAPDYLPSAVSVALQGLARFGPRRVIVNSRATAATVDAPSSSRVVVVYPGLPASAFTGSTTPTVDRSPVVGIVGRISETKGQRIFVKAAERLLTDRTGVRFRIVGSALFEDAAEERAVREIVDRSAALANAVEWTGWVADVPGELRRLSITVHASPVPEPFGQVVVEAMAAGVPVIGTDAGGVPEIIDPDGAAVALSDGVKRAEAGLLVRPGDDLALALAIEWMLDHPAEVKAMAATARESAERRFSIDLTWSSVAATWAASMRSRSAAARAGGG